MVTNTNSRELGNHKTERRLIVGVTTGASAYSLLRGQLAWFTANGWDVTIVSSPDPLAKAAAQREGVHLHGIKMQRHISPLGDLIALVRWITYIHRHKPTAVNVSTPKAGLLGIAAAWANRVPRRLYTIRGLRLEGTRWPLSWLLWLIERLSIALATDVLVVSRSLGAELGRRHLLPPRKTWIVGSGSSNGVDHLSIEHRVRDVDSQALRMSLGLPTEGTVLGYIGRIAPDKGVDALLDAMEHLDDLPVALLTIGTVEHTALQARLHLLGGRVKQIAWTDDVWGYLPAIDILCLPTRREGFPNVILEAASVGIPAITTRATGAIDAVVHGVTGYLFDVDNDWQLATLVRQLAEDPIEARRLGLAARDRVRSEFSQERIWQGIYEILGGAEVRRHAHRLDGGELS